MIDITFDAALGILRCVSSGGTSAADLEAFGRKAASSLAQARARGGGCLILVDASNTAVQSQESATAFTALTTLRQPGDRSAIIIGSAIAKLQSQRMTVRDDTAYFATESEAIAWLLEPARR